MEKTGRLVSLMPRKLSRGGRSWNAERRHAYSQRQRMRRWAVKYWPDVLRLLRP
jgi:hypothetical protein